MVLYRIAQLIKVIICVSSLLLSDINLDLLFLDLGFVLGDRLISIFDCSLEGPVALIGLPELLLQLVVLLLQVIIEFHSILLLHFKLVYLYFKVIHLRFVFLALNLKS